MLSDATMTQQNGDCFKFEGCFASQRQYIYPSIPVGSCNSYERNIREHAASAEPYSVLDVQLEYMWRSKVVALLLGLQLGYTITVVSFVSGTVEQEIHITSERTGHPANNWFQG